MSAPETMKADFDEDDPRDLVIIESPYHGRGTPHEGEVDENIAYARRALMNSLMNREAPIASHLLYPPVLDDSVPSFRSLGIEAGLAWIMGADKMVAYCDRGVSEGMRNAMFRALAYGVPVFKRWIDETAFREEEWHG